MKKLFLTVIIVFLMGCATSDSKNEAGVTYIKTDRIYINTRVGVSFKVPRGWEHTGAKGDDITFINNFNRDEVSVFNTSTMGVNISEPLADNTEEGLKQLSPRPINKSKIEKIYKKQKKIKLKSYKCVLHEIDGKLPGLVYSGKMVFDVRTIDWQFGYFWYKERTSRFKMYITPCYDGKKLCYVSFFVEMPDPKFYLMHRYDLQKLIDSFLAHYE